MFSNELSKDKLDASLTLYGQYNARVLKQYDLIWVGFKSYLTTNGAIFAVLGYLLKDHISKDVSQWPFAVALIFLVVCVFGAAMAGVWWYAGKDHWRWENVTQGMAAALETPDTI